MVTLFEQAGPARYGQRWTGQTATERGCGMGDVWISTEKLPGGGYRTVYAPVSGAPAPLTAGAPLDRDQVVAMIRDLDACLTADAPPAAARLAAALREAGAPQSLVTAALTGYYDEYTSELEYPTLQLLDDLTAAGMPRFVARVEAGEFDSPAPQRRHLSAAA